MKLPSRKRIGAVGLLVGGALLNEIFGWGVGGALDKAFSRLSWDMIASVRWGGVIGIVAIIIGLTILLWPSRKKAEVDPIRDLIVTGDRYLAMMNALQSNWAWRDHPARDVDDVNQVGVSALITFEKAGFRVPRLPVDPMDRAGELLNYFRSVVPILRGGHIEEARLLAEEMKRLELEREESSDEPEFVERL